VRIFRGGFNGEFSSDLRQFINQHSLGSKFQTRWIITYRELHLLGVVRIPESAFVSFEKNVVNVLQSQNHGLILVFKSLNGLNVFGNLGVSPYDPLTALALGG